MTHFLLDRNLGVAPFYHLVKRYIWVTQLAHSMPCADCNRLLAVTPDDKSSLFCPRCQGLPVEASAVVKAATNWLIEDFFTDEEIIGLVKEYNKPNLIYALIRRLNHVSNEFQKNLHRGLPITDFGYVTYVLKQVYEAEDFGEKLLDEPHEFDENIEVVREAYTELIYQLRRARNEFDVCIKKRRFTGQMENFASDYIRLQSEYGLCFERCIESLICGDPDLFEEFTCVMDVLRAVDKTDVENVDTLREFADAWYQLLLQMRLLASSDEMVGSIYFTRLPEEITIFEIGEFLDRLDSLFDEELHEKMEQESYVPPLKTEWVNECGRKAFDNNWSQIKDQVIVSEDNLDAHPFLFEIEVVEERRSPEFRQTRPVTTTNIYYPRFFARLLKFQIFPLLQNGDDESGHKLLSDLTGERGEACERNLYNYLTSNGIECYHEAEILHGDKCEIDLLCVFDDSLRFIEMKYFLPPKHINEPEGIRVLNEKFDLEIFNEEPEGSHRTADGKPFPEKVNAWIELEPGDPFTSQIGPEDGDREIHEVPKTWADLDMEMYVVSNVVPSYIKKREVRFLTDLEFYRWIEKGNEDVLYSLPDSD